MASYTITGERRKKDHEQNKKTKGLHLQNIQDIFRGFLKEFNSMNSNKCCLRRVPQ